jgi:hypothetical protein
MSPTSPDEWVLPLPRAFLRIGVTGHRIGPKFSVAASAEAQKTVGRVLGEMARLARDAVLRNGWAFADASPVLSTVSALAEGSDRIVAEAGLAAGHALNVILPFARADYRRDFESDASRATFDTLLSHAGSVFELDGSGKTAARAYEAAGLLMLANADVVIAIWDQLPADGIGGTALIVEHAVAEGVPVILIDPRTPAEASILWRADLMLPTARTGIEDLPRRALDALLPKMIALMLAPPDGAERAAFQALLDERPRTWNIAIAYPLLLFLVGVRKIHFGDFRSPDRRQGSVTRWRDYLRSDSRNKVLESVVTEKLLGAYSFADYFSIRYAQIYRSAYVFSYSAAAGAVLLALSSLLLPPDLKPELLICEIILIVAILLVIWRGGHNQWHRRWLEYRKLSETLRHLRLLAPLGAAARMDRPGNRAGRSHGWVGWYARAVEREIPLPNLAVDSAYLATVRDAVRFAELKSQIEYNRRNAHAMHKAGERLHLTGTCLFWTTLALCVLYLLFLAYATEVAHSYREWAVVFTALFPTVGAAINAIRAHGDFQSVAERSLETAQSLETLDAALAEEPLEFARLADRIEKVADVLIADVAEWHVLFRTLPLSLPA